MLSNNNVIGGVPVHDYEVNQKRLGPGLLCYLRRKSYHSLKIEGLSSKAYDTICGMGQVFIPQSWLRKTTIDYDFHRTTV